MNAALAAGLASLKIREIGVQTNCDEIDITDHDANLKPFL